MTTATSFKREGCPSSPTPQLSSLCLHPIFHARRAEGDSRERYRAGSAPSFHASKVTARLGHFPARGPRQSAKSRPNHCIASTIEKKDASRNGNWRVVQLGRRHCVGRWLESWKSTDEDCPLRLVGEVARAWKNYHQLWRLVGEWGSTKVRARREHHSANGISAARHRFPSG